MTLSYQAAFTGGGLERAAHLRPDAATLFGQARALSMVFWQGKPLVSDGGGLIWLPTDHPILAQASAPFFLGLSPHPLFAHDISAWVPSDLSGLPAGFFDQSVQRHPDLPADQGFRDLRATMAALSRLDAECAAIARALQNWHQTHGFCAKCGQESRITLSGWQRHCDSCGADHFPRTDPVVIMLVTDGDNLLLGRGPTWPEGMYSLLAGFIEPGETIEAAVRRETLEETAVKTGEVTILSSQPWPFPASLMIGCHARALTTEITLDPVELAAARWFTRSELALALAGTHPEMRQPRHGAIAAMLIADWVADRG